LNDDDRKFEPVLFIVLEFYHGVFMYYFVKDLLAVTCVQSNKDDCSVVTEQLVGIKMYRVV